MNTATTIVQGLKLVSSGRRVAQLTVAIAALLAMACARGAGLHVAPALWALVVVTAALATLAPDSAAPALLSVSVIFAWFVANHDTGRVTVWTFLAAGCLLVMHAAAGLYGSAPAQADVSRTTWITWCRRTGIVLIITALATALTWLIQQQSPRGKPALFLAALALLAVALIAGLANLSRSERSRGRR